MPRNREGVKVLFAELPRELLYRLQAVARLAHRSLTGQTTLAVEEHLSRHETPQSRELALRLAEGDAAGEGQAAPPRQAAKKPRRGQGKKA
jgi:hypothetical protein